MGPLSTLRVVSTISAIRLRRGDRAGIEQRLREHLLVADDGRPWRIAAQTRKVVLAGLHVELGELGHGLALVELRLLGATGGSAAVLGGLLGRGWGAICLRGSCLGIAISSSGLVLGLRRITGVLSLVGANFGVLLLVVCARGVWKCQGRSVGCGCTGSELLPD